MEVNPTESLARARVIFLENQRVLAHEELAAAMRDALKPLIASEGELSFDALRKLARICQLLELLETRSLQAGEREALDVMLRGMRLRLQRDALQCKTPAP